LITAGLASTSASQISIFVFINPAISGFSLLRKLEGGLLKYEIFVLL